MTQTVVDVLGVAAGLVLMRVGWWIRTTDRWRQRHWDAVSVWRGETTRGDLEAVVRAREGMLVEVIRYECERRLAEALAERDLGPSLAEWHGVKPRKLEVVQ